MDEGHTQLGAHQREMARTIRGPVVDVDALGQPSAPDRVLEHGQERGDALAAREGGVRDQARGIVEQGDEVRLVATPIVRVEDARAVHHIAHPQLVRRVEGEAAAVGRGRLRRRPRAQAVRGQQAMDGGARDDEIVREQVLRARGGDEARGTQRGLRFLQRAQPIRHVLRERARHAAVGP